MYIWHFRPPTAKVSWKRCKSSSVLMAFPALEMCMPRGGPFHEIRLLWPICRPRSPLNVAGYGSSGAASIFSAAACSYVKTQRANLCKIEPSIRKSGTHPSPTALGVFHCCGPLRLSHVHFEFMALGGCLSKLTQSFR